MIFLLQVLSRRCNERFQITNNPAGFDALSCLLKSLRSGLIEDLNWLDMERPEEEHRRFAWPYWLPTAIRTLLETCQPAVNLQKQGAGWIWGDSSSICEVNTKLVWTWCYWLDGIIGNPLGQCVVHYHYLPSTLHHNRLWSHRCESHLHKHFYTPSPLGTVLHPCLLFPQHCKVSFDVIAQMWKKIQQQSVHSLLKSAMQSYHLHSPSLFSSILESDIECKIISWPN